jgi:hypothetical protein
MILIGYRHGLRAAQLCDQQLHQVELCFCHHHNELAIGICEKKESVFVHIGRMGKICRFFSPPCFTDWKIENRFFCPYRTYGQQSSESICTPRSILQPIAFHRGDASENYKMAKQIYGRRHPGPASDRDKIIACSS